MRVLIIGVGGQVGERLASAALDQGDIVYGTYRSRQTSLALAGQYELDKTNRLEVERIVSDVAPGVIVDTAALHNVDYCETHPEEAYAVNKSGTENISYTSKRIGAKLVFISTDFVFDGTRAPYPEEAVPNPESVYAKSKLEGEKAVLRSSESSCVCRPSVIYSWVPPIKQVSTSFSGKPLNFAAWLVSQISMGKDVNIVTDQVASPTLADDLASAILAICRRESARGVYHTAGETALSRFDFAIKIARKLDMNERLIHPTTSSKLKQAAKRPANSTLLSNRIKDEIGYSMMNIEQALDKFAAASQTKSFPSSSNVSKDGEVSLR